MSELLKVEHVLNHNSVMPEDPSEGDLVVWHSFEEIGNGQTHHKYKVESADKASELIDKLADEQVNDESIGWNALGLVVYEDGDWTEWYDDEGFDIGESDQGETRTRGG